MPAFAYVLCIVTAFIAAVCLTRAWRATQGRLLLWSAACFWGLTIANGLALLDVFVLPAHDLAWPRLVTHLVSVSFLVYGLVWESR